MEARGVGASLHWRKGNRRVSRLPWLLLPLLFLPNLGLLRVTRFGALEISDFLIWPYMAAAVFVLLKRRGSAPKPSTMSAEIKELYPRVWPP